ncbi:zinc finger MYM-type protein 1-like [Platysternon megacephalum]|uniref:Zinc finger MYM-type protein 1-like n=1 Tax=Platysternon megacephalum TaxID=55544 RepID=A0A4D9DSR7_9SAUR|nr:zinc finger MYM-type protein 1-like [Platysternon megacephalum]
MTGRKKLSSSQFKKNAIQKKERENEMIAKMRKIDSFVVSVSADSETEKNVEKSSEVKSENIGVDIENIDVYKVHIKTNEEIPAAVSVEENVPNTSVSETTGNHVDLDIFDNTAEICESHQSEIQSDIGISTISDDPAQRILNDATIEYLSTHGMLWCRQQREPEFTSLSPAPVNWPELP